MRIDQILPTFSWGDAIGNHTLALRDTLRRWGFTSDVFIQMVHPRLVGESRFYEEYRRMDAPGNVLIYHYSIHSVQTRFFAELACRKVMIYHNITPAEYFRGINRRTEWECAEGRRELALLAGRTDLSLGDSDFNRRELAGLGYDPTGVLPIFIPFEDYRREPDRRILKEYGDGRPTVLHVGRFAPNKKIEDLVKAFFFLKRIRRDARLVLVGSDVNTENYSGAIREQVRRLGLEDVVFAGHVTFEELLAWYRVAGLYLSMSEHEGFCVPLVESMLMGVPVLAYARAAVPETLGDAGILLPEKDFPAAAEAMAAILQDETLRRALMESAGRRLAYFDRPNRERLLREHLASLGIRA